MVVYPYRQKNGRRSILEATCRDDARQWLRTFGKGTRFCEVEMDVVFLHYAQGGERIDFIVDSFLDCLRNFTT
jgi:hypothetical protein